jgi:hypothetical protein
LIQLRDKLRLAETDRQWFECACARDDTIRRNEPAQVGVVITGSIVRSDGSFRIRTRSISA